MTSTRPYHPRIAFVFDFDKTLASDSTDALLGQLGLSRDEWESRFRQPLGDGWDPILRRGHALITAAKTAGQPLTRELFDEAAAAITPFPGVLQMPDRLRNAVSAIHAPATCEFVILSSGFAELIEPTEIAGRFDRVFAGGFHLDGEGRAVTVKRTITHPEKALYLRALAEGLDIAEANAPGTSGDVVPEAEMHVLYDQMIYVGDGDSDLEAFGFLEGRGGLTVAIEDGARFDAAAEQSPDQRVQTLAPSDYGEGGALMRALTAAAQSCAARLALRSLSGGS